MRRFVPPSPAVLDYRRPAYVPPPDVELRTGALTAGALIASVCGTALVFVPLPIPVRLLALLAATILALVAVVAAHRSRGALRRWPAWLALLIPLACWAFIAYAIAMSIAFAASMAD